MNFTDEERAAACKRIFGAAVGLHPSLVADAFVNGLAELVVLIAKNDADAKGGTDALIGDLQYAVSAKLAALKVAGTSVMPANQAH
jgi:hypothetical protein